MTFLRKISGSQSHLTASDVVTTAASLPALRLSFRALEPRMVFDAALVATATAAADHASDAPAHHQPDAAPADHHAGLIDALHAIPPAPPGETIVFVDARVWNYQSIVANVAPGAKVVLLNARSGGLEQIASYLQGHHNVDSIHILSHGAEAELQLGSDLLTDANLAVHDAALAQIGHALRARGDILIYGCNVAAGADGSHFISKFASLTGDDVAASDNFTGAAAYGADWILEKQTGTIEALSIEARNWDGTLAAFSINAATAPVTTVGAHIGGPLNGNTATYKNVGTAVVGGVSTNIDLVATITSSTVGDSVVFSASGGAAAMSMGGSGGTDTGQVTVHWQLVLSGTATPFAADIKIAINDIDGAAPALIESVAASQTGLVTYSVAGTTNLVVTSTAGFIRADGTANESGGPTSIIQYSWVNTSNWDITYYTAAGATGRAFNNAGDSTYVIPGAVTIGSLLDLDGNDSTAAGFNYQNTFVENGAGVPVVDSDVKISNIDGSAVSPTATFTSATIVLTNAQAADQMLVGTLPASITAAINTSVAGKITVTLSGTDTAANYLLAMQAVTFKNTSDTPVTTDRNLAISMANGTALSNPTTSTIHVTAVDDAPVTVVPVAQTTAEDTARVFSSANGNAITISDIDAGAAGLQTVTLSVAHGTLTLGSVAGLTGLTGNGTGTVVFTGTVAQVNTAMNGLSYLNVADYNSTGPDTAGADKLTVSVVDDGKDTGVLASNGAQSAIVKTVAINIAAVADITNDTVTTPEDTPLTFNAGTGTFGATADTFENATHPITSVTQGANGSVTFLANGQITYTPNLNFNGTDSFTYTVTSGGVTETATVNVTITPVNDAPAATVPPAAQSVLEDTALIFSVANNNALTVSDLDAGSSGLETIVLSVGQGTLTLGAVGGLTGVTGNGTATVTFTGTTAQVNAAMSGLSYQGNANFNGSDLLTIKVTDDGKDLGNATSNGVLSAAVKTVGITVTPVNDAPVTAVPSAQSVAEDTALIFSGASAITIADVDAAAGGLETVTLTVAHGNLTLASTAGLTGLTGNGTGTVAFTGTLAQVNAAIAGLKYQGVANYNGPDLLTVQVTDDGKDNGVLAANGALSATVKTVAITVTPVNDPPVALNDTVAATEDTPVTIPASVLLANDTDIDGDPLSILSVQSPVNGTVTLVGGNPVFTPTANYFGPASFTYTISDGKGGTSTATVNLTIAPVNDAPVAVNDSFATGEKTVLAVPLASSLFNNDTDVDTAHANLALSQINGNAASPGAPITLPSGAILTPNADGTFAYNPNGAYNSLSTGATATDSFTYEVSDGQGGLATATAVITITGVNDNPVANTDFNSTDPATKILLSAGNSVLSNDTDVEHDTLTVSAVKGVAGNVGASVAGSNGGLFTINANGTYAFDPNGAFNGLPPGASATTSVTYTISDGHGGTSTTTLTVSVPYINLPPYVAAPMPAQSSLDGNVVSIPVTSVFADPNPGDTLTITASGLPPGLSYNSLTGAIEGALAANASQHAGPYIVTLTADDGHGATTTSTFTFNVGNPPPVAVNDTNTVTEHGTTTGAVLANDNDGSADSDPLTVTQMNGAAFTPGATITLPSGAQIVMTAAGTYSYDPHSAFNGLGLGQSATDTFTYQVSDGQGGFATATATITINGQNDAPVIVNPANPGTPPADPNHIIPAQTGLDGTAITPLAVKAFFKDPDNADTLTLSVTGALPAGVTFNATTGTFSGTPSATASQGGPANNGVYTVLVVADDGHGGIASTAVTFTIGNPPPVAVTDTNTVAEHATVGGNVVSNDHDGGGDTDPLTVSLVNGATLIPGGTIALPSGALLVMNTDGSYTYNPNGAFASLSAVQTATDSFTYQVSDGQGGLATATATIVIQGQNDNPVANLDTNSTTPQVAITAAAALGVLSNDTDAEHDVLSVSAVNGASSNVGAAVIGSNGGTFTINPDGSYAFNPGNAFDSLLPGTTATTSVTYAISDGHGGTSMSTLTISVPYSNLPPLVNQPVLAQSSSDGNAVSIDVSSVFKDPNPTDILAITAAGLPPGLSYNAATGAIEGTLTATASQHSGPYLVTLTASDGHGGSITSTFNFTVANPVPVAANDANSVTEHGTTAGAVLGNDHDGGLDTDTLTVAQVNGAAFTAGGVITLSSGALLVMQTNGTYSYDPNGAFNGLAIGQTVSDSFTYQVSDGQGGVATATVNITITGQNENPIIVDPAHPGTPIDPNHVVPPQTGSDGAAIVALNVTSFFADPDKIDTLTLSAPAASLPPGIVFNAATGTFSGTPLAGASQGGSANNGVYNVVVTAADGHGGFVSTTVTFTIANQAPVASNDSNTVLEHATASGDVLTNDIDGGGDADPLAVTQINGGGFTPGSPIVLPSGAQLTMNADGTYIYNPNGAFASLQVGQSVADKFTYQISDGQGGFSTATVTVVVQGQNDNPVANADVNTVLPQTSITVIAPLGVLNNDTDPEHDMLTVSAVNGAPANVGSAITGSNGGTFTVNADGSYTFDAGNAFDNLPPNTTATTSVTYTVDDGHGGNSTTTLTISVPFANLPPVVNQIVPGQSSLDGNPVSIDVSKVFKDPNPGDTLTITASGLPPGLSYNPATGAVEGTLNSDASQHAGPYTVTLQAKDSAGNTVSTTFNFNVSNPPPLAGNDINSVLEHGTTTGAVLSNDHDGGLDTDTLSVTQINGAPYAPGSTITLPSGAILVMSAGGTYSYDPHGAFNGLALGQTTSDSFTYQISDGQGGFSTATVAITITGQNEPPVVVDPAHPGPPADPNHVVPTQPGNDGSPISPLNVSSFFADPDASDLLAFSVPAASLPLGVTFNPATGIFSGTPDANASQGGPAHNGTYPVVVTATDSHGATVSTIVTFKIANPAPVATTDSNAVLEHGTTTGNVLSNDHDGGADTDVLAVTQVNGATITAGAAITLPSGAVLIINPNGSYSYDPHGAFAGLAAGQSATDSFTYQVSDGQGGLATATAYINIQGQNDAPVVVDPAHPGTPPADPNHVIPTQTASDGSPIAPFSVAQFFKDPDNGDKLTLAVPLASLPNGVTFDPVTGMFAGTPSVSASQGGPAGNGVYPIVITASDGHGGIVTTIITFTVSNPPPVAVNDVNTVAEHAGSVSGSVTSNDHDGGLDTDLLTVTKVNGAVLVSGTTITLPSGALLVMKSDGSYDYKPNGAFLSLAAGQTATDSFTYQVTDGQGGFATASVKITIVGQNDAPIVVDPHHPGVPAADPDHVVPTVKGKDGTAISPVSVAPLFHDPDHSDKLTLSVPAGSLPPGVVFDPKTGVFSGVPSANASQGGPAGNGVYPIVVTASDGHGGTVTTIVTFSFSNPVPVAVNDKALGQPDTPVVIAVLNNDHDGGSDTDHLTVTKASTLNGSVSINADGSLVFVPSPGFVGLATITYTISDGQGGISTATAVVLVTPNIHVTSPGMPDTPQQPLTVLPSNTGIAAEGAVVAAVHDAGGINSIGSGIAVKGIVDTVANQISGLGGIGGTRMGATVASIEPHETHTLWRTGLPTDSYFSRTSLVWQPEGLTGFSLRSTFATESATGREAQVVIESLVRERTLILRVFSTELAGHAKVVDYRVSMADGRALPSWLDRVGPQVLMGERPVNAEEVKLHVTAILSDGSTIERDVVVQTNSGEIQPLALGKRTEAAPLFSDQIQHLAQGRDNGFAKLLVALAG